MPPSFIRDDAGDDDWSPPYPGAHITPAEFERWVEDLLRTVGPELENLRVTGHEVIAGSDGSYDFDVTVRCRWFGLDFLLLFEAKRHTHPIKRELVQALHSKMQSVHAQKGVMVSTSPFQRGAVKFALAHGIALIFVTEGRFTWETRANASRLLSRDAALTRFGLPVFVGYCVEPSDLAAGVEGSPVSTQHPEAVRRLLLPPAGQD